MDSFYKSFSGDISPPGKLTTSEFKALRHLSIILKTDKSNTIVISDKIFYLNAKYIMIAQS